MSNTKTRVGAVLKEALHIRHSTNKSKDLEALKERYHETQKKIRHLLSHLKTEHSTMLKYYKARSEVRAQISQLTDETPLFEAAGSPAASDVDAQLDTYSSMHAAASKKASERADDFEKRIVDYVTEWHTVVTERVDVGIKKTVALRRDLDHYEHKMAHLTDKKSPDKDKVGRNESKETNARDAYENQVADMCILLEEVTERSWKDLIPLLARMAAWDKRSTEEEMVCLSKMNNVIDKLAAVAVEYNTEGCNRGDSSRFAKIANDEPVSLLAPEDKPEGLDDDSSKNNDHDSVDTFQDAKESENTAS